MALAIFSLVAVFAFGIFSATQESSNQLLGRSLQRQDESAALSLITSELRSAFLSVGKGYEGGLWQPQDVERAAEGDRQPQLLVNPPELGLDYLHGSALFFRTIQQGGQDGSLYVGYFVQFVDTDLGKRPRFCRLALDFRSAQTMIHELKSHDEASRASGLFPPNPNTPRTLARWIEDSDLLLEAPATQDQGYQGWVADNILAFFVRPVDHFQRGLSNYTRFVDTNSADGVLLRAGTGPGNHNGPPMDGRFDSRGGFQFRPPGAAANSLPINFYGPALPPAMEIVFVSTAPDTLRKYQGDVPEAIRPPAFDDSAFWGTIENYQESLPAILRNASRIRRVIVSLPGGIR